LSIKVQKIDTIKIKKAIRAINMRSFTCNLIQQIIFEIKNLKIVAVHENELAGSPTVP
jgi:hypothetical protein